MFKKVYIGVAVMTNTACINAQTAPLPPGHAGSVMNQVTEYLQDKSSNLNPFSGTAAMMNQLKESFEVLAQGKEYFDKATKNHHKTGAYRSGEGEPHQQYIRTKMFEENDKLKALQELEESREEIITDKDDIEKLYQIHQNNYQNGEVRARQNDQQDLVYFRSVPAKLNAIQTQTNSMGERRLGEEQQQQRPYQVIKQLEEPYPTSCNNHGQLTDQIQTYFMCKDLETNEEVRVTKDTYAMLRESYTDKFKCRQSDVNKKVCVCPQGFDDFNCSTQLYKKCFLNIIDPPFNEGCTNNQEDKELHKDSPYFLYSVPGYDPCFYFDFSKSYEISYMVTCRTIDENGMVKVQRENVGYEYRDVVSKPTYNPFKYVTHNQQTEFSLIDTDKAVVSFEFHDFKYLSNVSKTQQIIEDPQVLAGLKPATIELDFSKLEESDATGQSKFVVGGRAYFEANLFGYHTSSFTTKGFFDKEGFVEQEQNNDRPTKNQLHVHINEVMIKLRLQEFKTQYILICILLFVLYWTCTSAKKTQKNRHHKSKQKQD